MTLNLVLFSLVFLVGIVLGSFLNVVLYRSHLELPWWKGRSYCLSCKHQLSVIELVPLFSYLWLKGKCKNCSAPISLQYFLVELMSGVIFVTTFYVFNFTLEAILLALISLLLLGSFVSDLKYMELYEILTLPAILLAFIYQIFIKEQHFLPTVLSGLAVGSFFLAQYILTKGRGLGAGDIRLGLFLGTFFLWPTNLISVSVSYLLGSVIMLTLIALCKAKRESPLPLGVFLILGFYVTWIFEAQLLNLFRFT